jgi:hypothetical protein
MRDWLEYRWYGSRVDLVDVSVAEAGPDHPAQARIVFRQGGHSSKVSWLIAESCWFETYRRPGFYEFMRWALWVLPIAIIIHFAPAYRRAWAAFEGARNEQPTEVPQTIQEIVQEFWRAPLWKSLGRLFGVQIKLALAALLGIVIQVLLAVVAVTALVPGPTRSFAGWVQRKISATIGDSFLFVTSPITGAAIFTRVKKDLDWLSAQCDRVIILAHSQGAAVSYRVIARQFWEGQTYQNVHALITYGSGLRKLFDLETNVKGGYEKAVPGFWIIVCSWAIVTAVLMSALIALFLSGIISWWIALPGLLVGGVLEMVPLVTFSSPGFYQDPQVLPIPWYDLYSSHDPVPNGPIDVALPFGESDRIGAASKRDLAEFNSRQRVVVNWRSILSDHTSYWSSRDDFIGHIAAILGEASNMPIGGGVLDGNWMKVSRDRRLWRVTWLSRCRAVAALASLSILFWPLSMLEPAAGRVRESAATAAANLPERLAAWMPDAALVPDWLLGAGGLVLATYLICLVALASWISWERQDLTRFFKGEPYPSVGVAGWVFALGWVGVLVSAPAYALAHVHSNWWDVLAVLWAPFILAVWSAWKVYRPGRGPGTPVDLELRSRELVGIALAHAEKAFADKEGDRKKSLWEARRCFGLSRKYLGMKHSGSDEWVRAVVGETRALEELTKDLPVNDRTTDTYREAIEALKRAGRDVSEVQARLDKAVHEQIAGMSLEELRWRHRDRDQVVARINQLEEYNRISWTATQYIKLIKDDLNSVVTDAPYLNDITDAITALENAQKTGSLPNLQNAFNTLGHTYDSNKRNLERDRVNIP